MTTKKDGDTARAKEFLKCLGNGKTIYQVEEEESGGHAGRYTRVYQEGGEDDD